MLTRLHTPNPIVDCGFSVADAAEDPLGKEDFTRCGLGETRAEAPAASTP